MKCSDVRGSLIDLLEGTLSADQRMGIEAHLAGCAACRTEAAAHRALIGQVRDGLNSSAAAVNALPDAMIRLQTRLAHQQSGSLHWFSLSLLAAGALAFVLIVIAPTLAPAGLASMRAALVPAPPSLDKPYVPVDQPDGFSGWRRLTGTEAGMTVIEQHFHYRMGTFAVLVQQPAALNRPLPEGDPVFVNGVPGVRVDDQSGLLHVQAEFFRDLVQREDVVIEDSGTCPDMRYITYFNATRLTWIAGDLRFELLTNLPEDDMWKLIESLTQRAVLVAR
jgi:hypothetical protein